MIALGLRLALTTGRARIRMALTTLAVAAGVVLVLGAFAVPAAHDRAALRESLLDGFSGQGDTDGPAILWNPGVSGVYDGHGDPVRVVGAAVTGPGAPSLPGGVPVPSPGAMLVSPALASAMNGGDTAPRLARQLPLRTVGTVPTALVPRPDARVAIVGQERAALAPSGIRITSWRAPSGLRTPDPGPGDRIIRLLTPVIILVPILVLVGTAARIGRRGRDEQLASLRLAGASTRQLAVLAATEAAVASALGALLGGATYALLIHALTQVRLPTETLFAADMTPPPAAVAVALVGIPLVAASSVLLTIGRALSRPLAVRRAGAPTRPSLWRFGALALGWAGLVAGHWLGRGGIADLLLVLSGTALVLGVVLAGPWLVRRGASGLMLAFGGRPAALIGARRLLADSAGGFRAVTGIAAAAFVLTAVGVWFAGVADAERRDLARFSVPEAAGLATVRVSTPSDTTPVLRVVHASAPQAVILRGFHEEASGTEIMFADCAALRRRLPIAPDCRSPLVTPGREDLVGRDLRLGGSRGGSATVRIEHVGALPPAAVAWVGADALLPLSSAPPGLIPDDVTLVVPTTAADGLSGALLAASIPAYTYVLDARYESGLDNLALGLRGIVLLSFLLGAISLAVAGADDLLERRRELARLQADGVGARTLRAATALEQIEPLALGVAGATCAGLAVGATFVLLPPPGAGGDLSLVIPWGQLALIPVLSAAAGAIVLAATLPVLGRAIRPEALRAE